jgi:hypothetical protein
MFKIRMFCSFVQRKPFFLISVIVGDAVSTASSQRENERLLQRIAELETLNSSKSVHPFEKQSSSLRSDGEFRELEFKLAETRSKLARTQQAYDDLSLAKDSALIELEKERMIRVHVEKERDAYSAAYEQSLLHFERWSTKTKLTSKFALSR